MDNPVVPMIRTRAIAHLISLLTVAAIAPAKAQTPIEAPGTWQTTGNCKIQITYVTPASKQRKEIFAEKCYGVTVSVDKNANVHFEGSHPSMRNTIASYVLVDGPFRGAHPVRSVTLYVGTKDQTDIPADFGECKSEPGKLNSANTIIQCSVASENNDKGGYLSITSTALFSEPIEPGIAKELQ